MFKYKEESKDTVVLLLLLLVFVLFLISCTHSTTSSIATKDAIDICGCDRICVFRILNVKGYTEIHERTYDKSCGRK